LPLPHSHKVRPRSQRCSLPEILYIQTQLDPQLGRSLPCTPPIPFRRGPIARFLRHYPGHETRGLLMSAQSRFRESRGTRKCIGLREYVEAIPVVQVAKLTDPFREATHFSFVTSFVNALPRMVSSARWNPKNPLQAARFLLKN
jgi:hypothetical protein